MVNGAGLAMATMDIVKLAGGEPANFLDVGGGASPEQIENAFRILSSDPSVKAVFINVFGGILRCDRLAEGAHRRRDEARRRLPVVVRMEGTNVELGKKMLAESGPELHERRRHGRGGPARRGGRRRPSPRGCEGEASPPTGDVIRAPRRRSDQDGHAGGRPGDHRQGRHLPRRPVQGVRHAGRRRRDAGQGRHDARGLPGLEHRGRGGARSEGATAR